MIFDRTQSDVAAAISLRDTKIKNFQQLTQAETETLERGMLTINTLNRIEDKEAELGAILKAWNYISFDIEPKKWGINDIFKKDDFSRLTNNATKLRNAFSKEIGNQKKLTVAYSWQALNALEKLIYDIEQATVSAKKNFNYCGAFNAGALKVLNLEGL